MARISLGDFGYAVPKVTRTQAPTDDGIAGAAAARAGQQVESAGVNALYQAGYEQRRKEAEEKQRQREAAADQEKADRAAALRISTQSQTALYEAGDAFADEVRAGGHKDLTKFDERVSKAREAALKDAPPSQAEHIGVLFDADAGRVRRTAGNSIREHLQSTTLADLNTAREELSRNFTRDPVGAMQRFDAMAEGLGAAAGLGPAQVAKAKQEFREQGRYAQATAMVGASKLSMGAVAAAERRLQSDEFADMDPQRRVALENQLLGYRAYHQQRAEAAANRAARAAEAHSRAAAQTWDAAVGVVQAGKVLDPAYAEQAAKALQGTPYAKALGDLLKQAPAATAFASQPLANQRAALDAFNAKGNTKGWSPDEQEQYAKLEKSYKLAVSEYKEDPMRAAAERGVIADVPQLNFSDLNTLPQQLKQIADEALLVSRVAGRPVSGFTNEQAKQLGGMLSALPAEQKAGALRLVADGLRDHGRISALAGQLGDEHKGVGTALFLAGQGMKTTENRPIAELYLRGQDAIATGRAKIDGAKEIGTKAKIAAELEGVYATPQARDMAADVALKVYAARRAEGEGDDVGRAVRIATGGVMEHNGGRIAKPYGWSDSQFRDALAAVKPADIGPVAGTTPEQVAAQLPGARLQSVGSGRYAIQAGAGYVSRPDGSPVTIEIR